MIGRRMFSSETAPLDGNLLLRKNVCVSQLIGCLWLQHINRALRLRDEIRLVFQVLCAAAIKELKLATGWLEPLERFSFGNDREFRLGIRLKLLSRIEAAGEPTEGHIAFVRRRNSEIQGFLVNRCGVGATSKLREPARDNNVIYDLSVLPKMPLHLNANKEAEGPALSDWSPSFDASCGWETTVTVFC